MLNTKSDERNGIVHQSTRKGSDTQAPSCKGDSGLCSQPWNIMEARQTLLAAFHSNEPNPAGRKVQVPSDSLKQVPSVKISSPLSGVTTRILDTRAICDKLRLRTHDQTTMNWESARSCACISRVVCSGQTGGQMSTLRFCLASVRLPVCSQVSLLARPGWRLVRVN